MTVLFMRRRRAGARGGDARHVKRAVRATLEAEGATDREVSVLLTDDREIQELNATYRFKDKPTDVLAFALDEGEGGEIDPSLGDVVISVERALTQANARKVSLDAELELLAVHGTLHLLGYDHAEADEAKLMRARTRAIRRGLAELRPGPRMKVAADTVVSIEYVLKDEEGNVLDQKQGESLAYLHGHHNIVPGLEKALGGMEAGQSTQVILKPEEGYGAHDPGKVMKVAKEQLSSELEPQVGMMLHAEGPEGPMPLWITDVDDGAVTVDGNHPLAGKSLNFNVQITDVRAATSTELELGHVQGLGDGAPS